MTVTAPATAPAPAAPQPPWLWALRIVGLAIAGVTLAFGALSVVSTFMHREHTTTREFTQPITRLVADTDNGDVRIRAGAEGVPVQVTARVGESFDNARSSETLTNGVLRLVGRCRFIVLPDNCGVSYTVTVPAGTVVQVSTGTGDAVVHGTSATITISTGTGDVNVRDVSAARVHAQTGTGTVRLEFAAAPTDVVAQSGTGDVDITVPDDGNGYRVVTDSGIGDVTDNLRHNDTSTRSIHAETGTGDVRLNTGT
jgi:hypothetical protein